MRHSTLPAIPLAILAVCLVVAPRAGAAEANLLIVGDLGYKQPEQSPHTRAVAAGIAEYVRAGHIPLDAAIVPGDAMKVKLSGPDDKAFRAGFEEMYDPKILAVPFYMALGNHDQDAGAKAELAYSARHPDSRWKMPGRWYRVEIPAMSPLATLLVLDSAKDKMTSQEWKAQLKWLDEELAKPRAPWTLCCAHKPAFSDGSHGASHTVLGAFAPLLKKHNVDFYVSGHDHVLEHQQPEGWATTFIVSGGGGENTARPVSGRKAVFSGATAGFVHMRLTDNAARVWFIDASGKVLHSFEKERGAR